jgi:hypothetical protein
MLERTERESRDSGQKKTVVVCKGDFGVPNRGLMAMLKPLNPDKCKGHDPGIHLVKGQEYEFSGDTSLLTEKYPKGHQKAGQPRGLQLLFEVK